MSISKKLKTIALLDKISAALFFIAALSVRVSDLLRIPAVSMVLVPLWLSLYLISYLVWLYEGIRNPDIRKKEPHWYGWLSLKQQVTLTTLVGLVGTAMGFAAIFFPVLIIPCCWLFTVSNLLWLWSEYHKKETNPTVSGIPQDHKKQSDYLYYVSTIAVVSFLTSLLVTLSFFFPPFLFYSTPLIIFLGGGAAIAWTRMICYGFFDKPPQSPLGSTDAIRELGSLDNVDEPQPPHVANPIVNATRTPHHVIPSAARDLSSSGTIFK